MLHALIWEPAELVSCGDLGRFHQRPLRLLWISRGVAPGYLERALSPAKPPSHLQLDGGNMKPFTSDPTQPHGLCSGSRYPLVLFLVSALSFTFSAPPQHAEAPSKPPVLSTPTLSWQMMRGLNFHTGEMTSELQAIVNGVARVPGYMVPLEDNLEEVTELLLVPYPGACIHVPPPPPNQIVHVIMADNKKAQVRLWMEAVWVEGTLKLAEVTSRDGALSFFQLTATMLQSYAEGK
jgi:uncharacterized protein